MSDQEETAEEAAGIPLDPRARALLHAAERDPISYAKRMLLRCVIGIGMDPRMADIQRKAALDVLGEDFLKHMSDEALVAEMKRRHPDKP